MSNLLRRHPDILSLSEVFTSFTTRAFPARQLDGDAFWEMLGRCSPVLRKSITPQTSPIEFTYPFGPDADYHMDNLPACLMMTLPHLSTNPDQLYKELEPVIRAQPKRPLEGQYRFWFDWMTTHLDKKIWIERYGTSLSMLKSINRMFPDAKFVHIHRDGHETALSMQAFEPMRVFMHMRRRLKLIGIDIMRTPFRYSDSLIVNTFAPIIERVVPANAYLKQTPTLEQAGRFWSDMVDVGLADLAPIDPERIHTMRYCDLVDAPRETLSQFIDFAFPGGSHKAWLDEASEIPQRRPSKWDALSASEQTRLAGACATGMTLLGY